MCPHLGVLTARAKAGAWSGCSIGGRVSAWKLFLWDVHVGVIPENSRIKCFLSDVQVHFDCARSHKTVVPVLACSSLPDFFCVNNLFWDVHVHFDCARSNKTVVPVLVCGILIGKFRVSCLVWDVHVHWLGQRRLAQNGCPCEKILWRSWWNPLYEVLAWACTGPCEKIWWRAW